MKLLIRSTLVLVLLAVLLVFGLNWFLEKGLNPVIQKAIPSAEEKLGVNIAVGNASVSILTGSMALENVSLSNPEGFDRPEMFTLARSVQDIAIWPLIARREIRVEEVTIEDSNLTVVRNAEGLINLKVLLAALSEGAPPPEETPEKEPGELPAFHLEQLLVTSLLTYVREKESGDPFQLGLQLRIEGDGLGTTGDPTDRGNLSIRGNLAGNQELFVIGVKGTIAPITDPLKPTFELAGKVDSVEITMFELFRKDFRLNGGMMGLDMTLHADEGVIDPEASVVRVLISQPKIGSGLGIPSGFQPAKLAFPVKVSGTVQEPKVHFMDGLRRGIQDAVMEAGGIGAQLERAEEIADQARSQAEEAAAGLKEQAEKAKAELERKASEAKEQLTKDPSKALDALTGGDKDGDGSEEKKGFSPLF
ncbi:MAG: hypothetical protein ACLFRP_08000 [Puniceicoccaceae bacterium]